LADIPSSTVGPAAIALPVSPADVSG